MSSWLSLNPFKSFQENEENEDEDRKEEDDDEDEERQLQSPSRSAGVKEDLSELRKTIGRQLWGVASFLAPPPSTTTTTTAAAAAATTAVDGSDDSSPSSSSQRLLRIRNDFAEIGGSFKSRLSMLSSNLAVNEISKLASNFLQFEEDERARDEEASEEGSGIGGNVGVTEEVLEFVREISVKPEFWINFPLLLDNYDFDMSNSQREHASSVEHLVPDLVALRNKLCPDHMNDEQFWIVYFILVHPRLTKHDSELLSTPQILEARNLLLLKLQSKEITESQTSKADGLSLDVKDKNSDQQEVSVPTLKKEVLVKAINTEHQEEEDVDQWLEEEDVETGTAQNLLGNEQDVSFSDLEDDDDDNDNDNGTPSQGETSSSPQNAQVSSPSGSSGWVQLNENSQTKGRQKKTIREDSEGESSNDWLNVDGYHDFDSDSVGTV